MSFTLTLPDGTTVPVSGPAGYAPLVAAVPVGSTKSALQVAGADVSSANPVPVSIASGGGGGGGGAVTVADGANVTQGTTTDAAWSGTGAGTLVALLKAIFGAFASLVTTGAGKAARVVLVDPSTGNGSLVQAFHNADNQALGATAYGLMTGGVDQLLNSAGNLDRKRAVAGDAMAATGLAAETPMLWNGSSYDRAPGDKTNGAWVNLKSAVALTVSDSQSAAFQGAVAMTIGTTYAAQRSVGVLCTVAGNMSLTLANGSTITLPVYQGWQTFPFAATAINSSGTTATAIYYNLV